MYIESCEISCGVANPHGLNRVTGPQFVKEIKEYINNDDCCWDNQRPPERGFIFSDIVKYRGKGKLRADGGRGIANYLKKYKIGRLTTTPPYVNYNTGNLIQTWFWIPPASWYGKKNKRYLDRD